MPLKFFQNVEEGPLPKLDKAKTTALEMKAMATQISLEDMYAYMVSPDKEN